VGGVGDREEAARGQRRGELGQDLGDQVGVGFEVQHRDQQQPDRLGQVQGGPEVWVAQDVTGPGEVGVEVGGPPLRVAGQQRTGMGQDQGIRWCSSRRR